MKVVFFAWILLVVPVVAARASEPTAPPAAIAAHSENVDSRTHVIRKKRIAGRTVSTLEIDGQAFDDYTAVRKYVDTLPAGSVLRRRSPTWYTYLLMRASPPTVEEFAAYCRARGLVCDFYFGCP
jgi:hypothetical protein